MPSKYFHAHLNSDTNALLNGAVWKHGLDLRHDGGADEAAFHANCLRLLANSCHQSEVDGKVIGDNARHTALVQVLGTL